MGCPPIWSFTLVLLAIVHQNLAQRSRVGLNAIEGSYLPNPIAVNTSTFTGLLENGNIFIDKTQMIFNVVELWLGKLKIMARPHGWGKSTIMDMLKCFFELEVDPKGGYIAVGPHSRNYKLFSLGVHVSSSGQVRNLRDRFMITKHDRVVKEYQGQYVVLHFTLAGLKPKTLEEFERVAGERVRDALLKYEFHRRHDTLLLKENEEDKLVLEFLDRRNSVRGFSWNVLQSISRMVQKFIKLKPIILIDDYDEPLIEVLNDDTLPDKMNLVESMVNSYNALINLLRNSTSFHLFALLTGTLKMPIENEVPDTYFIQYYGLDYNETNLIFDYLDIPTELRKQAIAQYCGYEYATYDPHLCNAACIAKFVSTRQIRPCWQTDAAIHGVVGKCFRCPHFRKTVQRMLSGYDNYRFRELSYVFAIDFRNLSEFLHAPYRHSIQYSSLDVHHYDSMGIRVSHAAGYFTNLMVNRHSALVPYHYTERISNEEARQMLKTHLWSYYCAQLGVVGENALLPSVSDKFKEFFMHDGNATEDLKETFKQFLHTLPRFRAISLERDNVTVRAIVAYDVLNLIVVYMDYFELVASNEDAEFGSNILLKRGTRGVFAQMTLGRDSAELALNETGEYIFHMFRTHPSQSFEWIKRVGMNYCPNGTLQIDTTMTNVPSGQMYNLTMQYSEPRMDRVAAFIDDQIAKARNKTAAKKQTTKKVFKKKLKKKKKMGDAADADSGDVIDVEAKPDQ